ncbi:MAG: hypothetical protein AVDCRST_MAG53-2690, partial [uncultured Solirubrobacteraceae bacterium]
DRPSRHPRARPLAAGGRGGPLVGGPLRTAGRAGRGGRRRDHGAQGARLTLPRRPERALDRLRADRHGPGHGVAAGSLGAAPGRGRRLGLDGLAPGHPRRAGPLARRAPRALAELVARTLGARRGRRRGRRRDAGRHAHARALGGVAGLGRACARRGARAPPAPDGDVRRPGVAAGRRGSHTGPRARRPRLVAGRSRGLARRGRRATAAHGRAAHHGPL